MTRPPTRVGDVTPRWLSRHLGPTDDVEVERIGADHGFASTVLRVRARLSGGPTVLVLKLTSADAARREAWSLDRVRTWPVRPRPPRPRFLEVDDDRDVGVLAMDHVEGVQGDVLVPVEHSTVAALAEVLAVVHVRSTSLTDRLPDTVRGRDRPRFLVRDERLAALLAARAASVDAALAAGCSWLRDAAPAADDHLGGGPSTLVHGDVHLDNVLFTDRGPVLLDWEGVRLGTPAEDVARLALARTTTRPGGDVVAGICDRYRAAVRRAGGSPDPQLEGRVRSALVAAAAGMINWAGRLHAEAATTGRRRAVAGAVLDDVRRVLSLVR